MRILIDTNILFSAILFPRSKVANTLIYITRNHDMYLCDQNISELRKIVARKKPNLIHIVDIMLSEMSYTLVPAVYTSSYSIRDVKDQPILNAAVVEDIDIILTGDKDFLSLDLDRPECLSVAEFRDKYISS